MRITTLKYGSMDPNEGSKKTPRSLQCSHCDVTLQGLTKIQVNNFILAKQKLKYISKNACYWLILCYLLQGRLFIRPPS